MAAATPTREVVAVSLPLPLAAALRAYAKADDRTLSYAARKLIAAGLDETNGDGRSPATAARSSAARGPSRGSG